MCLEIIPGEVLFVLNIQINILSVCSAFDRVHFIWVYKVISVMRDNHRARQNPLTRINGAAPQWRGDRGPARRRNKQKPGVVSPGSALRVPDVQSGSRGTSIGINWKPIRNATSQTLPSGASESQSGFSTTLGEPQVVPQVLQRLRRSPTLGIGCRKGTWHPWCDPQSSPKSRDRKSTRLNSSHQR